MTHDELLAKVKDNPTTLAVVELHKPDSNYCDACDWQHAYPCPTIQAIEKELG